MRDRASSVAGAQPRDLGSAVAEFAMIIVVLLMLFLSLIQVCLWLYARNLVTSAAAESARYAANAYAPEFDVTARVSEHLSGQISAEVLATMTCATSQNGDLLEVNCQLDGPSLVGFLAGVIPVITVTSHAVVEQL